MKIEAAPKGISVIICCYNSAQRIGPTLEHLQKQETQGKFPWELIVVDNRCTDATVETVKKVWEGSDIPLQLLYEEEPGVSRARHQGILKARYEYVVFCDDDNYFYPDYLTIIWDILESRPDVKMIGGQGIPHPQGPAPFWLTTYAESYAAAPQGPVSGWAGTLYNAGMALRRKNFIQLHEAGFRFYLTSRKGNALTSGEDSELCFAYQMAGWGIWYEHTLRFLHAIPAARLNWDYLVRLHKGFSASYVVHRIYQSVLRPEEPFTPLRDMLYYLAIRIKYYPKFRKAVEGDKLILHYHGWWIIARDLWHHLWEGGNRKKAIEQLYARLRQLDKD